MQSNSSIGKSNIAWVIFFTFAAVPVLAADFDSSKPMVCSLAEINECNSGEDCKKVTSDMINAPNFLRIDTRKKTLSTVKAAGEEQLTKFEHMEEIDGRIMLLGAEDGDTEQKDGSGYALSINKITGRMIASVTGNDVAFTVFGACIND